MATKRVVEFHFKSNAQDLNKQLEKTGKNVNNIQSKLDMVSKKMVNVGENLTKNVTLPLLAVGTAATKVGMDFETSFAKASTLIDGSAVDMKNLRNEILALSDETGIAATELNEGLYQALSAGVPITGDAAETMAFMTQNVKLAKAGFTNTETAIDTTTSVLNAYKMEIEDVGKVSEILMKTQNYGKTTIGELGATISKVTPTAAAMGVEFEQVGAALAVLTASGVPTAEATTQLNVLFAELGKQGTKASTALMSAQKSAGMAPMSFTEMMKAGYTVTDVLKLMDAEATKNNVSMLDMFGSIEAGKAALGLANDMEKFNVVLKDMTTGAGVLDEAFAKVTDTSQERMTRAFNNLKNAGIELFASLAPIVDKLSQAIGKLAKWFSSLDEGTKETIVKVALFAAALGPVITIVGKVIAAVTFLIKVFKWLKTAWAVITGLMALNPFVLIAIGIVALIALIWHFRDIIWEVITKVFKFITDIYVAWWTKIFEGLELIKNAFTNAFMWIYEKVIQPLVSIYMGIFNKIWSIIFSVIEKIKNGFSKARDFIINIFTVVKDTIASIFSSIVGIIKKPINAIIGLVNKVIIGNLNKLKIPDWVPKELGGGKGLNFPKIPQLASGGIVDSATTAIIGEGADPEAVVPLNERGINSFLGGLNMTAGAKTPMASGTTINVTVPAAKIAVMDANYNKIGSIIMPQIIRKLKTGGAN